MPATAAPERTARDELVVGYFGVLYSSKQPDLMLRTIAELKRRGTKVRLLVAGDFLPDRPQDKTHFFDLAQNLGITENIDFRGRIEASADVLAALAEADVQMLLFSDGASARRSSLLTALQLERPVVTTAPLLPDEFTDWPDIEQQMADGAIACVAPDADPATIADAVVRTARQHPSRPRIDSANVWARAGEAHAQLYEALIAGSARRGATTAPEVAVAPKPVLGASGSSPSARG